MITDEELTQRLGRQALSKQTLGMPAGAVALLVSETRIKAESGSFRRKILAASVGATVVGGGFVAGPATADAVRHFLAQTDALFGGSEVIEHSEFVDTSAADLGAYIESIYPTWLPLAPGQTREGVIEQVRAQHAANPGVTQEVGIRRSLERAAYLGWLHEWIEAHTAGDVGRMDVASGILLDAAAWPAVVATDGGGVTYIMSRFAQEIAAGNVDAAQELAQVELAPFWDGVDRGSNSLRDSYFSKFAKEYEAGK